MHRAADKTPLLSGLPLNAMHILKTGLVVLGLCTIVLALATYILDLNLASTYQWLKTAFGPLFLTLFTLLCGLGIYAITRLKCNAVAEQKLEVWYETGQQAASGIATLALTFTLLGISLGIDSLSKQSLSPETVNAVIQELTRHFSTAFMTTVVGLPTAHLIRSVLSVRWVAIQQP